MSVYKAISLQDLINKQIIEKTSHTINDIQINHIETSGLSGSKMYKIEVKLCDSSKFYYLKVNNLKEDWLARVSNDRGRELIIFKENIYSKIEEFIKDIYLGYYINKDCYAILMEDMSEYIGSNNNMDKYFQYLDNLAKFHSKFRECDVYLYKELLSVNEYYDFLTISKVGQVEEIKELNELGWKRIKKALGEELYEKYNKLSKLNQVDKFYHYYPKTFIHGDYRPDNIVYFDDTNIQLIDFANSGCGPCTLDLFWYIISSVDVEIDKNELIHFYKNRLSEYLGYEYTDKTWTTLLEVGILCTCRMFLAHTMSNTDFDNKYEAMNVDWWIENLKYILKHNQ